jgi:hypothetical protein
LRTASAKTECRNVMTLRTVFGAEPRASMLLDIAVRDPVHAAPADGRRDVHPLHGRAVLPVREPGALDRDLVAQLVRRLVDGRSGVLLPDVDLRRHVACHVLAKRSFGLPPRKPFLAAALPDLAEATVHVAAVRRPPTPVERAPLHVDTARAVLS